MESIKFSELFHVVKPKYKYFKITPNNSVRNNSTYKISRAIASLYKNIFQRIKCEEKEIIKKFGKEFIIGTKYSFNTFEKVGYLVYIEKKSVEFYFVIPEQYESLIKDKANDSWSGVTITEAKQLPQFKESSVKYNLVYEKEDALSLNVDRRDNDLLRSNLNIINVLDEEDKVGIYYNFTPTMQSAWRNKHKHTIEKVKNKQPVDRDKSKLSYLFKYGFTMLTNILDSVFEAIAGKNEEKDDLAGAILGRMNGVENLTQSTMRKENSIVLETQITILSESQSKMKQINNAKSISQSFESIAEDNRLVAKKNNSKFNYNDYKVKGAPTNITSDAECQNFISIAGREMLEEYSFIEKVETKETKVPEELQKGVIRIGENTYRGNKQQAYLSNDKEYKNLTQMLVGPTRAGKSTLIGNMSYDTLNNDECVVMFDFIKNCELSDEVSQLFPKDKVLNIECSNFDRLQGLGYNEVGYEEDVFKQYDNAKKQTTQLMTLVNSINDEFVLTAKMERYLTSASLIAFISNGSIKDVFDILQNHKIRSKYVSLVPNRQKENLEEYIFALKSLDEFDKDGNLIGTKLNLVAGIIDRLNKLKANTYMELMLKKGTENNIDLSKEIQKNQIICLKMPEDMFNTDGERDIYTTYWITKLWLALQMRAKRIKDRSKHTKVNLVIDEIYQVENTEKFLTEKLSRLAKFGMKPIISCHYINQLRHMRNELRSANTSYMLISGCDKNNYNELKEELYPFQMEDLLNLKRYNSLNLVKHQNGYGKFITKLPKPVNEKEAEKVSKSYLQAESSVV